MNRIILYLLLIAQTMTPMERQDSVYNLRRLLLTEQAQEMNKVSLCEKFKQLFSRLASNLSADAENSETEPYHRSPRESMIDEDVPTVDAAILQTYGQRSTTICPRLGHQKLLIHATASYPNAADFTCLRKNPHWRHLKSKRLKQMDLEELSTQIHGQVEIDSYDGLQKLPCCIFTSFDISTISLNNTGDTLAIAGSQDEQNVLLLYQIHHGVGSKKIKSFYTAHLPVLIAFSPSGKNIFMCSFQSSIHAIGKLHAQAFSLESGDEVAELQGFDQLQKIYDLQCGWLNEHEIVAFDGLNNGYRWSVPSEPAGE